ncbi:nuclear transport factor 2 family protein [uncultured Pseudoteredinibacter sp.]|uniref:nuclear transport factor 2 family protein n=1 Tax=uncultured Pseudoteredinibacter sp. TaxID=1641701 RepID=UPI0026368E28|nr:nuclear transport factor 2 family protein [uncultured Pseudoteredinibacter sp.]
MTQPRPPLPPFSLETAKAKVQAAEDAWNSKDPVAVSMAYSEDSQWRNRDAFFSGREAIQQFLSQKWQKEQDYKLKKELWSFTENRIAVTFQYEWHDEDQQWYRSYGNELWEFNDDGLMSRRIASINDVPIQAFERQLTP